MNGYFVAPMFITVHICIFQNPYLIPIASLNFFSISSLDKCGKAADFFPISISLLVLSSVLTYFIYDCNSVLHVKEVKVGENRYILCFNPKEARKDRATREKWIERIEFLLPLINSGDRNIREIKEHPSMKRLCIQNDNGVWTLDEEKIKEKEKCDGLYIVRTSKKELPASEVATSYKNLQKVEQTFHY